MINEPRSNGSVAEQAAAWLADKAFGGKPQYWTVDLSAKPHPEIALEVTGVAGVPAFRVTLNFQIRVRNARLVLENNVSDLEGYFTAFLRQRIADLASRRDLSETERLRQEIDRQFGMGTEVCDNLVEARHLTAQVRPINEDVVADLHKAGQVSTKQKAFAADTAIKRAQIQEAAKLTEGMTIHEFAHAVILSNNPELIESYQRLLHRHNDEGLRNRETLEWLLANNVVEARQIQKYIGLDDETMERLAKSATRMRDDLGALPPP
jgi:hypothetical protein